MEEAFSFPPEELIEGRHDQRKKGFRRWESLRQEAIDVREQANTLIAIVATNDAVDDADESANGQGTEQRGVGDRPKKRRSKLDVVLVYSCHCEAKRPDSLLHQRRPAELVVGQIPSDGLMQLSVRTIQDLDDQGPDVEIIFPTRCG